VSDDFFRTRMGHTFYESTMPSLARELARLNDNLERLAALLDRPAAAAAAPPEPKPEEPR
jgi:hypothetical protein